RKTFTKENPNAECRTKAILSSFFDFQILAFWLWLRISDFGFPSDFGFRISGCSSRRSPLRRWGDCPLSFMPYVSCFAKIHNFLSDIGGVVGDPFEALRDDHQVQATVDGVRILYHLPGQLAMNFFIQSIY